MSEGDEPPENGEGEPAQHETERENENGPAPLNVHHGRENVGQIATPAFGNVVLHDVALAILQHDTLANAARTPPVLPVPAKIKNHLKIQNSKFQNSKSTIKFKLQN